MTDSFTEQHDLRFLVKSFAHALDVILASLRLVINRIARRALERRGSCSQEPTSESDVFIFVIEFVFLVVDGL